MKNSEIHSIVAALFVLVSQACATAGPGPNAPGPKAKNAEEEGAAAKGAGSEPTEGGSETAGIDGLNVRSAHSNNEESSSATNHENVQNGDGQEGDLPLPAGTKVLHVGDSFAGALGKPLGELLESAGVRSVLKHTDSSYLTDWAWDGNLTKYLWKYNPDLVIVTLGANELEIVKPELREKTVRKIVEMIGDRPCVWVAIPLWDGPKNGLLDVIKSHSTPCLYMDTNVLFDTTKMARISDGIHPTTNARKAWADDVLAWLKQRRSPTPERSWNLETAQ